MRFRSVFKLAKLTRTIGSAAPCRAWVLRVCAEPAFSSADIVSARVIRRSGVLAAFGAAGSFVLTGMFEPSCRVKRRHDPVAFNLGRLSLIRPLSLEEGPDHRRSVRLPGRSAQ